MGTCQEHVPAIEQQGHLSPASAETEPELLAAVDLQHPEGVQGGGRHSAPGNLVEQVFRESGIFRNWCQDP